MKYIFRWFCNSEKRNFSFNLNEFLVCLQVTRISPWLISPWLPVNTPIFPSNKLLFLGVQVLIRARISIHHLERAWICQQSCIRLKQTTVGFNFVIVEIVQDERHFRSWCLELCAPHVLMVPSITVSLQNYISSWRPTKNSCRF